MSVLAIIPARGGSKRIPRKNIKSFLGKPIIAYSIQAALQVESFDEVMVSTDDHEIAEIAQQYNAQVPFLRKEVTSNDFAMLVDVLEEVLQDYEKIGKKWDYVCCILPTAPFVSAYRLRQGYALLLKHNADSVIPVTQFSYPIQRSFRIDQNLLEMFWPENYNLRSQDLEVAYHDAGQFYWLKVESLLVQKRVFTTHTIPLVLPELEVQDIDTLEDWEMAEMKFRIRYEKESTNEVLY